MHIQTKGSNEITYTNKEMIGYILFLVKRGGSLIEFRVQILPHTRLFGYLFKIIDVILFDYYYFIFFLCV